MNSAILLISKMHGVVVLCLLIIQVSAAADLRCSSLPPGIRKLRRGVDITVLDLLPLDLGSNGQDGFRKPVIDFTCNEKVTWKDRRQNTYNLPDQVWDVLNVPGGWSNANVKIFRSYKEIKISSARSVGLGLNFSRGVFSASSSYKKMQNTLQITSNYFEEVSVYDAAMRVDLQPAFLMKPNRPMKYMIDRLPVDFTSNPTAYVNFIRYFGTHFFTSGQFGGTIKLLIETRSSYYNGKTTNDIETQAKASFLNSVKVSGSGSRSRYQVDKNFRNSSTESLRYFGGDVNLQSKGLSSWQPTVVTNPWLFSGELTPISEFVQDGKKRKSLERAIQAHLNRAYLFEMERLMQLVRLPGAASVLKRVRAELAKLEPNQAVVDSLGKEVTNDFTIPTWFHDDLQFCYKWYADGDSGQCDAVNNLLCARPGQMTSPYEDDTDSRAGGCRMSWGLIPTSRTQPRWFHDVKVCYRWYADGNSGQCSSARGSVCSSLGEFTHPYRDDTDRRGGSCLMSWQLSVPSSSPKWLKNVQLCLHWWATGDGGQCGDGVTRDLCAKTNSWTPYYADDTDRRRGGCKMQWGLKMG